jgi:hypothetical protein
MSPTIRLDMPDTPSDRAVWGIVATNAVVVGVAAIGDGGLLMLLWPYWVQSVVIGAFAARRIYVLERFSTDGFSINDRAVEPTRSTARQTAGFFVLHYGIFHLVYLGFLIGFTATAGAIGIVPVTDTSSGEVYQFAVGVMSRWDHLWLVVLGIGFWQSHGASHREHVAADLAGTPKIGTLMGLPYARILPMHLTIIFGALLGGGGSVVLFGGLKTLADVIMHKVEHRLLQQGASHTPRG